MQKRDTRIINFSKPLALGGLAALGIYLLYRAEDPSPNPGSAGGR